MFSAGRDLPEQVSHASLPCWRGVGDTAGAAGSLGLHFGGFALTRRAARQSPSRHGARGQARAEGRTIGRVGLRLLAEIRELGVRVSVQGWRAPRL